MVLDLCGQRVYFVGIGGIGMGGLAIALKNMGAVVAGCDRAALYDPVRGQLKAADIPWVETWDVDDASRFAPTLVIIGNVCTAQNPVAQWAIAQDVPYEHMAAFAAKLAHLVGSRHQIVVAGTHGKTTTSMLIRDVLRCAGKEVSSFVGGFGPDGEPGVIVRAPSEYFVYEGDEYDCAFYDKQAKFMYYGGTLAVLTSCEHDHVDIYPTMEKMVEAYKGWLTVLRPSAHLWVSTTLHAQPVWRESLQPCLKPDTTVHVYGDAASRPEIAYQKSDDGRLLIFNRQKQIAAFSRVAIPNEGFYQSICAAFGIGMHAGLALSDIERCVCEFRGIARRWRTLRSDGIVVIDDFAHHPTAVQMNLCALAAQYPDRRLCAVFEPRSAIARSDILHAQWVAAFKHADVLVFAPIFAGSQVRIQKTLNISGISADIEVAGVHSEVSRDRKEMLEHIRKTVQKGDLWVLFSNGNLSDAAELLAGIPVSSG